LSRSTKVGICRVVNKKEQFQKSKERTIAAKEKKQSNKKEEKEIQLTWGVALNDLHHKLKRAQQTLEKGGRTSIVITSPKGSKAPQQDDRRMFADMIKDQLGLNAGKATVWKADEWKGSKTAVFLEGVKHAT
jgi:translation initiation factor IF-3